MKTTSPSNLLPAVWLGLSVAIGHGIARFGYALVMPSMQADLGWGYEQASWINTANALGYIAGTASGFLMLRRFSARRLFRAGLWLTVTSVPLMAISAGFGAFLVLRVLSGWGAAWVFSTGGVLVTELYGSDERRKGAATGLFFGGAGIGMMLTGAVTPALFAMQGASAWPWAWLLLGAFCVAMMVLPMHAAKGEGGPSVAAVASARLDLKHSPLAMLGYFGFAASHTGYIFFVFAWTRTQQLPWYHGAGMWTVIGAGVLASAFVWQRALGRWRAEKTMALCFAVCSLGSALPVISPQLGTVYLSAACVGLSLFIGPASMTALVRQTLAPAVWGKAMMIYALVFALGQALGSWAFGLVADTWSLAAVLGVGSTGLILSTIAAAIAGTQARGTASATPS